MKWDLPEREFQRCIERQGSTDHSQQASDFVNSNCAFEAGKKWFVGPVGLNVHNNCNETLQVWKGSTLHFKDPIIATQPEANLKPGTGCRLQATEREVWGVVNARGNQLLQWVVDVSDGVIQDYNVHGDMCMDGA
jgi:hypothetical protein